MRIDYAIVYYIITFLYHSLKMPYLLYLYNSFIHDGVWSHAIAITSLSPLVASALVMLLDLFSCLLKKQKHTLTLARL